MPVLQNRAGRTPGRCPEPRRGGCPSPNPAGCGWCAATFSSGVPQQQRERKHATSGQAGFAGPPVRKRTGENGGDFRKNEQARFSEIPAVFFLPGSSPVVIRSSRRSLLVFYDCGIARVGPGTMSLVQGSGGYTQLAIRAQCTHAYNTPNITSLCQENTKS